MEGELLPTGVPSIDRLLGGGLEGDSVTELYGEGGTAKTILCLQATIRVARSNRWVFYIDTEGVSADRLSAMTEGNPEAVLRRVLLSSPSSLQEQSHAVETACGLAREGSRPVGLIVLDSATMFYRLTFGEPLEEEGRLALATQLAHLVSTALSVPVPVLVTNQVWRNVATGALEPVGGTFVSHAAKTILHFERLAGDRRRAVLVKHRSRPEGSADFRITAAGLE